MKLQETKSRLLYFLSIDQGKENTFWSFACRTKISGYFLTHKIYKFTHVSFEQEDHCHAFLSRQNNILY